MTFWIPFDTFDASLMGLPNSDWLLGGVDSPEIYFRLTGSSQVLIILPGDVNYLTRLVELVSGFFANRIRVPN
jgi:hypothetical protein